MARPTLSERAPELCECGHRRADHLEWSGRSCMVGWAPYRCPCRRFQEASPDWPGPSS